MTEEEGAMAMPKSELGQLTDEELAARREQLAYDVRADPERRTDLEEAEAEMARRVVATKREQAAEAEGRRRAIQAMTTPQLEQLRSSLGALSRSEAEADGRLAILHKELRRREESRSAQAAAGVPAAEARVQETAAEWEHALAKLATTTNKLSAAIVARSNVRQTAYGELPRAARDQDLVRERCAATVAEAVRPGSIGEPGWMRYRSHTIDELI